LLIKFIDSLGKFIICVREEHVDERPENVKNALVAIQISDGQVTVLAQGKDFYSSPRFNPKNSNEFAYISWSMI
jgi:membrane carboxypeptidase/penicillin-binding protein